MVLGKVVVTEISQENQLPNSCSKDTKEDARSKNALKVCLESHHYMVDEILRREALEDPEEFERYSDPDSDSDSDLEEE